MLQPRHSLDPKVCQTNISMWNKSYHECRNIQSVQNIQSYYNREYCTDLIYNIISHSSR